MRSRSSVQLELAMPAPRAAEPAPQVELPFPDLDDADDTPFEVEADPPDLRPLPEREELLARTRDFAALISERLDRPVRVSVTDNRSTMISYRRLENVLLLRIHHMFLEAPEDVRKAVADYAGRGRRQASMVIDAFVRANTTAIRQGHRDSPQSRLEAQGRVWDLRAIFDEVNTAVFGGAIDARIGWGRAPTNGRRRTIRMGVYDHVSRTIRIHPSLDRPEVPRFFVEYIVFHEMLHQAIPGKDHGSRRVHHGADFRRRERAWPGYARAVAWERENIALLLGRPAGKRARPVD